MKHCLRLPRPALQAGKRRNPHEGVVFEPAPLQRFAAAPGSLTSHSGGVTALALHPSKPVGASGDGGGGWVLWHLEGGERIMSAASAHPQGLRAVAFHPKVRRRPLPGPMKSWGC